MKTTDAMKRFGLAAGLLLALVPFGAQAAATVAGTTVTNNVTLDFKVNGTAQTQQTTNASFKVDNKMVLSVANNDGADVTVNTQPGSTVAASKFTVTNNGNGVVDAVLSAVNMASGTTDPNGGTSNQTTTTTGLYSDSACTTTIGPVLSNMAVGASQVVYVCSTIPAGATNGQIAVVGLLAKVGVAGSGVALASDDSGTNKNTSTTTLNTEYNIFAEPVSTHPATGDAAKDDGAASDLGAYKVQAATLTLSKTVKVLQDALCYDASLPVAQRTAPGQCGTAGYPVSPHAIPGALVQYTVTIANAAGAQNATSLDIKDLLSGNTTYVTNSMTVNSTSCNDVSPGNTVTGIGASNSTATCNNVAPNLEVSGFTVGASETVTITYNATVN